MKPKVAILGNWNEYYEPHFTLNACLMDFKEIIEVEWIATELLLHHAAALLSSFSGIIAGSGPYKSKEGVINGIRYARENNIAFLGTCSGFGYAVLEFGQWVFNLPAVYHPHEGIELTAGETFLEPLQFCSKEMHTISFTPVSGTQTAHLYNVAAMVNEQSHCNYGVNRKMIDAFEKMGLVVAGKDQEGETKIMEYNRNNFFIIMLFLPQLKQGIGLMHPLISAFVNAATSLTINN